MNLTDYNKKRRFDDTPEPEGAAAQDGQKLIFVVQRHDASHLHYDFRLEADGVLKSWAVPKGPSLYPKDRRLAVQVEDHPVSYATFTGDIPAGNYGAGHVDVWDHGTYEAVDEKGKAISQTALLKALSAGSVRFVMHGKKLRGLFKLFRMKDGDKNWLLMKGDDEFATHEPYDIEHGGAIKASKKSAPKLPEIKEPAAGKKLTDFIRPMMARLHDAPFDDPDWLFEIKWDGYRAIAEIGASVTKLYSRNGLSFEQDYPEIFAALNALKTDAVIDGEIVAFDDENNPKFQLLQNAGSNGRQLVYYVFDCLYLDGKSIEHLPLTERKKLLKNLLPKESDSIHFCDHVTGAGIDFFRVAEQRGLEGIIAKRANSIYAEGSRSPDWLKVKHLHTDEAIIAGFTEPKGARQYFGALILGAYRDGVLHYLGHTGTGFDNAGLKALYDRMIPLKTGSSPFSEKVHVNAPVTWISPELVCAIKYTEVTADGQFRHPVYMGLRKDKYAEEVTGTDAAPIKNATLENKKNAGGKSVALTNTTKIFWPEEGYTKGDVIAYYNAIYKYIIKYLKGRPLSLRRNPNGIADQGFFQKDAGNSAPDWVRTQIIFSDSTQKDVDYIICDDKPTLLYLANLGCIELNPWHSQVENLERPDYLLLDLDPSDANTFDQVIETAQAIKQVLDEAGAPSWCKTSGSTGLHIYVPMHARYTYEQVNTFAEIIATHAQELLPEFTSLERGLKKRGNKIYIDFMQNNIAQTVACPYSLRPKPHATVSAPLAWTEVRKGLDMQRFNIKSMAKRLEEKGDFFTGVLRKGIDMGKCLRRLEK